MNYPMRRVLPMRAKLAVMAALIGLCSCSAKLNKVTVFYKQDTGQEYTNHKGEICETSGLIIDGENLTITEYFRNCDFFMKRKLREHEPEQWGLKKRIRR